MVLGSEFYLLIDKKMGTSQRHGGNHLNVTKLEI